MMLLENYTCVCTTIIFFPALRSLTIVSGEICIRQSKCIMVASTIRGGNRSQSQCPLHSPIQSLNFLAQNCIKLEPGPFNARPLHFLGQNLWPFTTPTYNAQTTPSICIDRCKIRLHGGHLWRNRPIYPDLRVYDHLFTKIIPLTLLRQNKFGSPSSFTRIIHRC